MSVVERRPRDRQVDDLYAPIAHDLVEVDRLLFDQLRSRVRFIDELTGRVRLYQGKRIRPALLLLAARACGEVTRDHYLLGAVIEMIHAATLVHDDLLDDADTRRHATTVHSEWGSEAAVLLGDFLFSHAYYLAATLKTTEACQLIGQATNRTCEGELRQVGRRGAFELSEEEYFEIITGKTAELIACACQLGARFAGAEPPVVEAMTRFGRQLGMAFQIADDLLDVVGDEGRTGKSIGTDWVKRKMTLPLIRLRETASESTREKFRQIFEDQSDRWTEIVSLLRTSDAVSYSDARAHHYAAAAARELAVLPDGPCRDRLVQIAKFAAHRSE